MGRINYKYILLFVALFSINTNMHSQNIDQSIKEMSSVPIQNPDIAAINKFVEFPVSLFNGNVDVSLPLYEIKLKNITIPITLRYHTGGIRVTEDASWVGLGWALDAGGVISHQINGKDDQLTANRFFGSYYPYTNNERNEQYLDGYPGTCIYGLKLPNKNGELEDVSYEFCELDFDGEPDLYMYSLGNYSGKFIYYQNKEIDLSCNNIVFKLSYGPNNDSIVARTPDGAIYKFKDIERTISVTGAPESGDFFDMETTMPKVSAYYLTEIVTTNKELVKFYYKTFKQKCEEKQWGTYYPNYYATPFLHIDDRYYPLPPSLYECYSYVKNKNVAVYGPSDDWNYVREMSHTLTTMVQLEKIEFPYGTIEFEKGRREDMYGFKLDNIYVKNKNGEIIKSISFNYDYFVANKPGLGEEVSTASLTGRNYKSNYPEDFMKRRLKLISMSERNNINTREEKYSFKYYEEIKLPYKTSFSQDFWGYYNNSINKSLLPSFSKYASSMNLPDYFKNVEGGKRDVHPNAIKAGMLEEIRYPTGGKTVFEFEPNETKASLSSSGVFEKKTASAIDIGVGKSQQTFTVKSGSVDINILLLKSNTSVISDPFVTRINTLYAQMEKYDESLKTWSFHTDWVWCWNDLASNGSYVVEKRLQNKILEPGIYRLTANFPDRDAKYGGYGANMASISVTYDTLITQNIYLKNYAGGLRVKQISKTDVNTNKSVATSYVYSNGVLATTPTFYYTYFFNHTYTDQSTHYCNTIERQVYYLMQNAIYPYSFSANGNLVGYKDVSEIFSNGELGRIDYNYHMEPDNVYSVGPNIIPGIPPTSHLTNGFLKSKIIYKKDQSNPINNTTYQYILFNAKPYWGFKINPGVKQSRWCNDSFGEAFTPEKMGHYMQTNFFPIIQGKVFVKSVNEQMFTDSKNRIPVQKKTDYEYNNEGFLKLKKICSSKMDDCIIETYKYSRDLSASSILYKKMANDYNILTPLIEKVTSRNGNMVLQKTNYYESAASLFLPLSFQTKTDNNTLETRLTFDKYNSLGSPISITKNGVEKIVYLWGYNGLYPIAEIRNATYSDVLSKIAGGQQTIDAIAAKNEPSSSDFEMINNLRILLPKALVSTYTYKPLVGMLTATDPQGIIRYYDYDTFGRLNSIKNAEGELLESYEYNYQN